MPFNWTREKEDQLLFLRDKEKKSFNEIAKEIGTTTSSIKHKYIRINQKANDDRHHHPIEKIDQINRVIGGLGKDSLCILEAHGGWGNLTKHYHLFGEVTVHEIDKEKVSYIDSLGMEDVDVIKADSQAAMYQYNWMRMWWDVIDLDPYGYPSRYFPHVFGLFKKEGILFITIPKLAVQQMNKITIEHLRALWGISLADKDLYADKVIKKIQDHAFQYNKSARILDLIEIGGVFRMAFHVKEESMLDLVGLKVKGKNS